MFVSAELLAANGNGIGVRTTPTTKPDNVEKKMSSFAVICRWAAELDLFEPRRVPVDQAEAQPDLQTICIDRPPVERHIYGGRLTR